MLNYLKILTSISFASSIYLSSCSNLAAKTTGIFLANQQTSTTPLSQNLSSVEDWENAELLYTLWGHSRAIANIAFAPNGELLASSDGLDIVIWDLKTGQSQTVLPGHLSTVSGGTYPAPIAALAFSPKGKMLASSSWSQGIVADDSLIIWDTQTGEKIHRLAGSQGCNDVIFSPDGGKLISSCGLGIQVWNAKTGEKLLPFYEDRPVGEIALSPQGTVLAAVDLNVSGGWAGEDSRAIRLWRLTDTEAAPFHTLEGHSEQVNKIAFNVNGNYLVSSNYDNTIKVWDGQKGELLQTLSAYTPYDENNASFSLNPNGTLIAGNFSDGIIRNLETGEKADNGIPIRMQGNANALAFSPNGRILAWTGQPPTFPYPVIRLWRASETAATDPYRGEDIDRRDRANYQKTALDTAASDSHTDLTGNNPKAIVRRLFGFSELPEPQQQTMELDYPRPNKAVVTLTQTGLWDDSVAARQYRVELISFGNNWEAITIGKRFG